MSAGISNEDLEKFIKRRTKLNANFCGVFAIDQLKDDFVTCASKVYRKSQRSAKLPFAIANTDPINKGGTHWFSLMKLQDISGAIDNDSFFMFDSFGLVGFTSFIVQDDSELISTFLIDLRSDESYENMINLYSFTFLPNVYLRLTENEIDKLSALLAKVYLISLLLLQYHKTWKR